MAKNGTPPEIDINNPNPPEPHPNAPKYTSVSELTELITVKGLTCEQAGKLLGISKVSAWQMCQRHGIMTRTGMDKYKANRADMLAAKGEQLLKTLTPDEIKKMPPASRVVSFGILTDKERLERGQATTIVGSDELSDEITKRSKQIKDMEDSLTADGLLGDVVAATEGQDEGENGG